MQTANFPIGWGGLGEKNGYSPVSALALLYMEPVTHNDAVTDKKNHREDGFAMGFSASLHPLERNTAVISGLLAKVREIYEMDDPPHGHADCADCQIVEKMLGFARDLPDS